MEFQIYNSITNLISLIYDWRFGDDLQFIQDLEESISNLEHEFRIEISENLYDIHTNNEREKLVKKYLTEIAEWKYNVFNKKIYDEDEVENDHLAPKTVYVAIQDSFDAMVDIICEECFSHNIDLEKIQSESNYINTFLDLSYYYEKLDYILMNNKKNNHKQFQKIFNYKKAYDFYVYLLENLNLNDLVKHSTIYCKMIEDELIDKTTRPERYKKLLRLSEFKIEIKYSLKTQNTIGKKSLEKYDNLRDTFFKN
jgi:hypothetical protein